METVDELLQGMLSLLWRCDLSRHIYLSRDNDDEVRVDIGKNDFRSVLLHPMLSSANQGHPVEIKLNVM